MTGSLIVSAAGFGFLGSLHCAFMCGPLAIAGCTVAERVRSGNVAKYLGGRLVSHAFAGAIFGELGAHAAHHLSMTAVQRGLLLFVALLAIGKGLSLLLPRWRTSLVQIRRRGPTRLACLFASMLPRRALALGLTTGALPCGLLAGGWALATSSGHPLGGVLVMSVFCVATTPALLVSLFASGRVARLFVSPAWNGALWCALGVWISVRPLLEHLRPRRALIQWSGALRSDCRYLAGRGHSLLLTTGYGWGDFY